MGNANCGQKVMAPIDAISLDWVPFLGNSVAVSDSNVLSYNYLHFLMMIASIMMLFKDKFSLALTVMNKSSVFLAPAPACFTVSKGLPYCNAGSRNGKFTDICKSMLGQTKQ